MKQVAIIALLWLLLYGCKPAGNGVNTGNTAKSETVAVKEPAAVKEEPVAVNYDSAVRAFIPQEYLLFKMQKGRLNADTLTDIVAILKFKSEENYYKRLPRPMLILFQEPQGKFKLKYKVDSLVLCERCGGMIGDPLQSLKIEKQTIKIALAGGSRDRWNIEREFTYAPAVDNFILTKDNERSFDSLGEYPETHKSNKKLIEAKTTIDKYPAQYMGF